GARAGPADRGRHRTRAEARPDRAADRGRAADPRRRPRSRLRPQPLRPEPVAAVLGHALGPELVARDPGRLDRRRPRPSSHLAAARWLRRGHVSLRRRPRLLLPRPARWLEAVADGRGGVPAHRRRLDGDAVVEPAAPRDAGPRGSLDAPPEHERPGRVGVAELHLRRCRGAVSRPPRRRQPRRRGLATSDAAWLVVSPLKTYRLKSNHF